MLTLPKKPLVLQTNQLIAPAFADKGLLHMMLPWGLNARTDGASAVHCMKLTVLS